MRPKPRKPTEDVYASSELVEEYPEYGLDVGDPVRIVYDINGEVVTILYLGEPMQGPYDNDNDPED